MVGPLSGPCVCGCFSAPGCPCHAVVRRVDQMEESHVNRGRGRPKKTIRETIRKDLVVIELDSNLVYDRTRWRNLIHVADPT